MHSARGAACRDRPSPAPTPPALQPRDARGSLRLLVPLLPFPSPQQPFEVLRLLCFKCSAKVVFFSLGSCTNHKGQGA